MAQRIRGCFDALAFLNVSGTLIQLFLEENALIALSLHFRWQFAWVGPWYQKMALVSCEKPLKVAVLNVLTANPSPDKVTGWLAKQELDFIGLLEVDSAWVKRLKKLEEIFPYQVEEPMPDNFGLMFLSRYPVQSHSVLQYAFDTPISLEVNLALPDGQEVLVLLTHPVPPLGEGYILRNAQLNGMIERLRYNRKPVILMGDFNLSMGERLHDFLTLRTGLKNCRQGFGWLPSWQADSILGIPIDHIFTSQDFGTMDFSIGEDVGSDHRPVLADLCLRG